jgi:Uncharacterised protein family (UPF0158)
MLPSSRTVKFDDLLSALEWSSSGESDDNTAVLSRTTGEVFLKSELGDFDQELPDDIEDDAIYIEVPHKNDLGLGRALAINFIDLTAPHLAKTVHAYFKNRGAYSKFKALLEREALLDRWYKFESEATRTALLEWASEYGFRVIEPRSAA